MECDVMDGSVSMVLNRRSKQKREGEPTGTDFALVSSRFWRNRIQDRRTEREDGPELTGLGLWVTEQKIGRRTGHATGSLPSCHVI